MSRIVFSLYILVVSTTFAAAQTPEETIRWIYSSLASGAPAAQTGLDFLSAPAQRDAYFSDRMVTFYRANESYGAAFPDACIDFGFAIPGQDYNGAEILRSLQVSRQETARGLTVFADFVTFGQPARISYDFIAEDGFWKIDDISGANFRVSQIPCTPKADPPAPSAQSPAGAFCYQNGADSLRLGLNGTTATLEFISWQANGHSCSGDMTGFAVEGGWMFQGFGACFLHLRRDANGGLDLIDRDWACKQTMCGQRAVIDGMHFPRASQVDCAALPSTGH